MALIKQMVSSKTNEWATPQGLFNYLDMLFGGFTLDPCATKENTKCSRFYTLEDDGLSKSWEKETVFMNPPYGGHTREWLEKAYKESLGGATVVCLIVSATDRTYWHDLISKYADEIWFMRGRVKFGGKDTTAPFASAIIIFRSSSQRGEVKWVDMRQYHQGKQNHLLDKKLEN